MVDHIWRNFPCLIRWYSIPMRPVIRWMGHSSKIWIGSLIISPEKGMGEPWGTTANWIISSHRDWLSPVVALLKQKLLLQHYLHVDETLLHVLKEPGRKNTTDSYMWVYSSIKEAPIQSTFLNTNLAETENILRSSWPPIKYLYILIPIEDTKRLLITRCFCWINCLSWRKTCIRSLLVMGRKGFCGNPPQVKAGSCIYLCF